MQLDGFGKIFKSHAFRTIATGGMYDTFKYSAKAAGMLAKGAMGGAGAASAADPAGSTTLPVTQNSANAHNDFKKYALLGGGAIVFLGALWYITRHK